MKFLFDLGGVFFDWDPNYFYKDVFEDDEERKIFFNNICNDEWNIQQDAGRSIKEAEVDLIPKFPDYEDKIKLYYKNHHKMIRENFEDSVDVLDSLKIKIINVMFYLIGLAETFQGMDKRLSIFK